MSRSLILSSDGLENSPVSLTIGMLPVTMGRSRVVELRISDQQMSRRHAEIRCGRTGDFELVDLESTNLTIVNGVDIEQHVLHSGDVITLGDTEIEVLIVISDFNEQTTRECNVLPQDSTFDDERPTS